MIKAILNGILNMISSLITLFLSPVNALLNGLFPNFGVVITAFNNITSYINSYISYFLYLIPPTTKTILIMFLTLYISYMGIRLTYVGITKIFGIIQRIKFW